MRIVSLVPSWTETLIECGFDVVGRTRFCIHPEEKVKGILPVGGTKDINWSKISALHPDLVILDREENPKSFADNCLVRWWASHVRSVEDVARDLNELLHLLTDSGADGTALRNLEALVFRWQSVCSRPHATGSKNWTEFPGVIRWYHPAQGTEINLLYLIWYMPWMAVSCDTFIGSVLSLVGWGTALRKFETPYPKIEMDALVDDKTVLLFSSEPYPFAKKEKAIQALNRPAALVDGEKFSWFGLRTLKFIEEVLDSAATSR